MLYTWPASKLKMSEFIINYADFDCTLCLKCLYLKILSQIKPKPLFGGYCIQMKVIFQVQVQSEPEMSNCEKLLFLFFFQTVIIWVVCLATLRVKNTEYIIPSSQMYYMWSLWTLSFMNEWLAALAKLRGLPIRKWQTPWQNHIYYQVTCSQI